MYKDLEKKSGFLRDLSKDEINILHQKTETEADKIIESIIASKESINNFLRYKYYKYNIGTYYFSAKTC